MFRKKTNVDEVLQETIHGTEGIPAPENKTVITHNNKKRRISLFKKKVKPISTKPKKPNLIKRLFTTNKFKRKKGIDGF